MKDGETLDQLDARFTGIINELTNLGRIYTNPEMNRKILRALPSIWNMKVTSMMDNKTYVPMSVQELFAELKAHEYELERMCNKASVSPAGPLALAVIDPRGKIKASDAMPEYVEEEFAMILRKMRRFLKKKGFSGKPQYRRWE